METVSGLAGFGECGELDPGDLRFAIERLRGQPVTGVEMLGRMLAGRPGLNAAVNMAALDIASKFAKVPLHQYLGGPTRFKVRAMTRIEGTTEAELVESMNRARQSGYRAFLVPLPGARARALLEALRLAAGAGVDFVLEGPAAQSPAAAASLCRAFESFHPYWLDEPCAASNVQAARRLSSESVTPLGFGRDIDSAARFEDLLREEAIDVLRPSIAVHGVTGIRKIAAMAETRYAAVAPYHAGGPVGTAAALHLAASLPNFFIQQIPFATAEPDRAMRASIGGALEAVLEGFVALPKGSGLGIAPDVKALDRYMEVSR